MPIKEMSPGQKLFHEYQCSKVGVSVEATEKEKHKALMHLPSWETTDPKVQARWEETARLKENSQNKDVNELG